MPRIQVHPSLILWLSVLWYLSSDLVVPFLLAAALHEAGHWLALCSMQKPPCSIQCSFSGAAMETPPLSYREELIAAAAGPGASLLLGLLMPLWPELGFFSLGLGLFNLLPLWGLDGGRMLRCALLLHLPEATAESVCRWVSAGTGTVLVLLAFHAAQRYHLGLWPVAAAVFLLLKALLTMSL